ncbi:type VII secretion protein EccE [Nocardia sp. 2YAB30]|uniref:type VII secretion protein EccE n=1 Tax=unclassified Nocardia TaxID=2637762 RepID=UPI003F9C033D
MASTTADPAVAVSAPPLHSPQNWLFRTLPLRLVIPVVLVAIAVALVAVSFDAPTPYAAGGGALVAVIGLTRLRGSSLAGFLDEEIAFRWHAFRNRSSVVSHAPFDVPLPEGGTYGMRWDGAHLITMLRIDAPPRFVTLLSPSGLSSGDKVPLPELARCLSQFDIDLASIDVISTGARTSDAGPVARLYDQILGPLPAVAQRTVWIVLRLNPLANVGAVDRRGGGSTGTLRSGIVATRRVANRLAARGLTASVLSAAEMTAVVHQLTRGASLDQLRETSQGLEHDGIYSTSYRMALEALGPRGFADVWATQSLATTMTVRLRRAAADGTPAQSAGSAPIAVSATVRFDTRHEPAEVSAPGLIPMPGKQYRALLHSLPISAQGPELPIDSSFGTPDSLASLSMPIAGCGQLIGADSSGHGVALPLVGQRVRRVEIIGALLIAKQVILRAIALGATVVVHTNRHEAWREMVAYVDSPQLLSLAAWSAGSQQANSHRAASVIIYDGIPPSTHHSDATVMLLRSRSVAGDYFDPDVTLTEDPETANRVTVQTAAGTTTVDMVATPFEMTYLGVPRPIPV